MTLRRVCRQIESLANNSAFFLGYFFHFETQSFVSSHEGDFLYARVSDLKIARTQEITLIQRNIFGAENNLYNVTFRELFGIELHRNPTRAHLEAFFPDNGR